MREGLAFTFMGGIKQRERERESITFKRRGHSCNPSSDMETAAPHCPNHRHSGWNKTYVNNAHKQNERRSTACKEQMFVQPNENVGCPQSNTFHALIGTEIKKFIA